MGHSGKRPGAGRHPGTLNKASARREQAIAQTGPTPLDVIIRLMRYHMGIAEHELMRKNPNKNQVKTAFAHALDAAHKAAPFVHLRLSSVEHGSKIDPTRLTKDELTISRGADLWRLALCSGVVLNRNGYDFTINGPVQSPVFCLEEFETVNGSTFTECRSP